MTIAVTHSEVVDCESHKMSKVTDRRRTSPIPIQFGNKRGQKNHRCFNNQARQSASSDEGRKSPMKILPRGTDLGKFPGSPGYQNPRNLPQGGRRSNRTPPPKTRPDSTIYNERTTDYSSYNSASSSDEAKSENNYAGARFHSPPAATVLPKPPSHWMNNQNGLSFPPTALDLCLQQTLTMHAMSAQLKGILKVPIQA